MSTTACPLCNCRDLTPSWLHLTFDGKKFDYLECSSCRSLICDPMPDEETLVKMYDVSYCEPETAAASGEFDAPDKFSEVVRLLQTLEPGVFVDFGCGDGKLLRTVKKMGWGAVGIDFNTDFAADVRNEGIEIKGVGEELGFQADVLHLGDVLEHLTDLETQFPKIISLLKDGGLLVAHGPLEGNPNVFFKAVRFVKKLRGNSPTEMPPYHVILATTEGQQNLFTSHALADEDFRVTEIAFPAPDSLAVREVTDLRKTALFILRKLSQSLSPKEVGNRFFYIGRKRG